LETSSINVFTRMSKRPDLDHMHLAHRNHTEPWMLHSYDEMDLDSGVPCIVNYALGLRLRTLR
jgi:hypothetical protein